MGFYSALSDEITADPLERGYAGMDDAQVAASLNAKDRQRNRGSMTALEISANIDKADWDALSPADQDRILSVLSMGEIDPSGIWTDVFVSAFGEGSTTIGNLQAARVESISRAVELGLPIIDSAHVTDARGI